MAKALIYIEFIFVEIVDIILHVIFDALQGKFGDLQLRKVYLPYYRILLIAMVVKIVFTFFTFIYPAIEFLAKLAMCFRN